MHAQGSARPTGTLGLTVIRGNGSVEYVERGPGRTTWPSTLKLADILEHGHPQRSCSDEVNAWRKANRPHLHRRLKRVLAAKALRIPTVYGALFLEVIRGDGTRLPYGLASVAVVTDTGVGYIVDAFQNLVELENMKFHGFGTGSTAESAGQTALVTELTTEYATDNVRPTGTQTETAANVYSTVGTLDPDADVVLREHGIFSQAATGGGVMLDRSMFAAVSLTGATGDTVAASYGFTLTSGS